MTRAKMEDAEFDKFANEYTDIHARNIRLSGEGPEFFARYKIEDVLGLTTALGYSPKRILDFGSGVGVSIPHWRQLLPDSELVCLDISERSLEAARQQFPEAAEYSSYDGRLIPYPAERFDVVFAACVFHHIDGALQGEVLEELRRVLSHDGLLFIFEHNPFNPLTVHAFNTCEFDEGAKLIRARALRRLVHSAGFRHTSLAYRLFFPGMLRQLRPLERRLEWLPLGAQYRLVGRP